MMKKTKKEFAGALLGQNSHNINKKIFKTKMDNILL